jgi:hypothetical protein
MALLELALEECDEVIVAIGSAQQDDPFGIEQRSDAVATFLAARADHPWRIVPVIDPVPMEGWPAYVAAAVAPYETPCAFYRADRMEESDEDALLALGFTVRYVTRRTFMWVGPDGVTRTSASASDIKRTFAALGEALTSRWCTTSGVVAAPERDVVTIGDDVGRVRAARGARDATSNRTRRECRCGIHVGRLYT